MKFLWLSLLMFLILFQNLIYMFFLFLWQNVNFLFNCFVSTELFLREDKHFHVQFHRIRSGHFMSKYWKYAPYDEDNGWRVFISCWVAVFCAPSNFMKVFLAKCSLAWRLNIWISCQWKRMDRIDESTNTILISIDAGKQFKKSVKLNWKK